MNGDAEGVASRPRPLSGGLWTLFSWLRRDERASSNESLSSVGSARTAASFAFLAPAHYGVNNSPVFLPPPSPPTDSYKKRVQERNVRRQHERDLTLHRKYGLYRSEGINGFDAFSLPPTRRLEDLSSKWERDRRATSECCQRRSLHVPGKRRAPLPPIPGSDKSPVTHLSGRRKRRAPQPPIQLNKENEVGKSDTHNTHMNSQLIRDDKSLQKNSSTVTDTPEKCSKKGTGCKEIKPRSEKGFLKHIFENRKRNSSIDTSAVKILPNISELDKQAASIIENGKLSGLKANLSDLDIQHGKTQLDNSIKKPIAENWFCIKCLRKYDSSVSECPYCIFEKKNVHSIISITNTAKDHASNIHTQTEGGLVGQAPNSNYKNEEKQKLKEMLKEMKDSLPKRSKHEHKEIIIPKIKTANESIYPKDPVSDAPTLRIGASINNDNKTNLLSKPSTSGFNKNLITSKDTSPLGSFQNVIITQPVVIKHIVTGEMNNQISKSQHNNVNSNDSTRDRIKNISSSINVQNHENSLVQSSNENKNLLTPLRISSLLNPAYVPKTEASQVETENVLRIEKAVMDVAVDPRPIKATPTKIDSSFTTNSKMSSIPISSKPDTAKPHTDSGMDYKENLKQGKIALPTEKLNEMKTTISNTKQSNDTSTVSYAQPSTSTENDMKIKTSNISGLNQHIIRRELINQLEKSIANGNEHAAAEAAIKLAQLRLSCSVLSFSSQIISEPTPSASDASHATSNLELVKNDNLKEPANKSKTDNNMITQNIKINIKNEPTASSSQIFFLEQSKIKINCSLENDKIVHPGNKNESESNKPPVIKIHKDTQNPEPTRTPMVKGNACNDVLISVWVEDKEATRGPIKLKTQRNANVGDLRRQAQVALDLPSQLQRWIVGRTLCVDDNIPLVTLAGTEFNAPFYLCLVETELHTTPNSSEKKVEETQNSNNDNGNNVYNELVQLEQQALVPNAEVFECAVCMEECKPGSGVILRECVHMFCKDCVADVVRHSEEPDISCPAMGCGGVLQEREIRGLVSPDDYEKWLARGLAAAESGTRNAFHCRTKDCTGWALCDPGVRRFLCPVCKHSNCVPCQAIHEGETCEKYHSKLNKAASNPNSSQSDDSTQALLTNLINKGEALECPECKTIITKMWGCDWVKCSACKTEICWVTRGRRWGPGGRGDTSAGCRCGVDGKRCHPSCGYCH